jgi:protein SCO1/2
MTDFHPKVLALTGSQEQIASVTKNYKVYYAKREQPGMDGYLMDHQAYIFAMGPEGNFVRLFSSRDKPEDIVAAFRPVLTKNEAQ